MKEACFCPPYSEGSKWWEAIEANFKWDSY